MLSASILRWCCIFLNHESAPLNQFLLKLLLDQYTYYFSLFLVFSEAEDNVLRIEYEREDVVEEVMMKQVDDITESVHEDLPFIELESDSNSNVIPMEVNPTDATEGTSSGSRSPYELVPVPIPVVEVLNHPLDSLIAFRNRRLPQEE